MHREPAGSTCPHCRAPVAPDQRYCLSCGRQCSPLRLPFLDVLQESPQHAPIMAGIAQNGHLPQAGYLPPLQPSGRAGVLNRYAGVFALVGMLLLTAVIGLLIGHWANGSGGSSGAGAGGVQVIKVEGLGAVAPTAATAVTTSSSTSASAEGGSGGQEHETKQEERENSGSNLAKPRKQSAAAQKRLSKLTGKKYEQEINKIANSPAPIETGG